MEGIFNLKQRIHRLEQRLEILVQLVAGLGTTGRGEGPPTSAASGALYYDTIGRNLYFNEGTEASPSWILIS